MNSKWVVIALCVSIAANLVLGGFVLGQGLKRGGEFGTDHVRAFPRWARELPEPRRDAVRPYVREHFKALRPHVRGLREQHSDIREALVAEPYDPEELSRALAALRSAMDDMRLSGDTAFASFVAELSDAERHALAQDLARPRLRRNRDEPKRGPPPRSE